jgi:hypothetical protein
LIASGSFAREQSAEATVSVTYVRGFWRIDILQLAMAGMPAIDVRPKVRRRRRHEARSHHNSCNISGRR